MRNKERRIEELYNFFYHHMDVKERFDWKVKAAKEGCYNPVFFYIREMLIYRGVEYDASEHNKLFGQQTNTE